MPYFAPIPTAELTAVAVVYLWASRRPARWDPLRSYAFVAGLGVVALALGPLDAIADGSLSGHMTQHLLLIFVAPPLLLAGAPLRLALATLPVLTGRAIVRLLRSRPLQFALRPAVALSGFVVLILGTHVPGFYEAAIRHPMLHASEHVVYLLAGLLLWMPVLAPSPMPGRLSPLGRVLYLLFAMFPGAVIGLALMTAASPVYPIYGTGAGAVDDQWLAGMIMWASGAAILGAAIVVLGWRGLLEEERRQRIRDAHETRTTAGGGAS